MNKTFSLARTAECIPASSVADSARPELGSVLRARIYGLFNGGRLQIRRAVNQPSSRPPHRAQCTVGIVGGVDRPIKYWVHALPRLRATSPEGRERERERSFFRVSFIGGTSSRGKNGSYINENEAGG